MNQKAQKYITSKKKELQKIKVSEKESFLIEQGLCEKVFAPNPEQFGINHTEYPYSERNEQNGSTVYYKLVPIDLTDEEFAEVYSAFKAVEDELNKEDGEKYLQLLKDKIVNEDTVRFSDLMSPAILIHLTPSLRRYKEITKMNIAEPTNKESDVRLLQEKWRCCSDLIIILMDVAERLYGITL